MKIVFEKEDLIYLIQNIRGIYRDTEELGKILGAPISNLWIDYANRMLDLIEKKTNRSWPADIWCDLFDKDPLTENILAKIEKLPTVECNNQN